MSIYRDFTVVPIVNIIYSIKYIIVEQYVKIKLKNG